MTLRIKSIADLGPAVRALNSIGEVAKTPRYLNQSAVFDGHTFDSKSELARYHTLKAMQSSGLIEGLRVHPKYPLNVPSGELVGNYEADFDYRQDGKLIVEDCKSPRTAQLALYRWKRRHLALQYGIEVRDIVKRWKKRDAQAIA